LIESNYTLLTGFVNVLFFPPFSVFLSYFFQVFGAKPMAVFGNNRAIFEIALQAIFMLALLITPEDAEAFDALDKKTGHFFHLAFYSFSIGISSEMGW
jgi:glycopeptide antibiotics resistance protein